MKLFRHHLKQNFCPLLSNLKNRLCVEWKSVVGARLKKDLFHHRFPVFNSKSGVIDTWVHQDNQHHRQLNAQLLKTIAY